MKVMFISKELNGTSGAGVGARMHLKALKRIVGEDNVFIIDVSPSSQEKRNNNYIAYGKYKSKIERLKRTLQGHTFQFSNAIIRDIVKTAKEKCIDFVFVDDSYYGPLVKQMKEEMPSIPVVSFFHDVKAELFPKWRKFVSFIDKIDIEIGLKNERISVNYSDKNIVLNKEEDFLLQKHYGKKADYYLPVCVEKGTGETDDVYLNNGKKRILFVGTKYQPNIDAMLWFSSNVLCAVSEYYDLYIVGKGLETLKESLPSESIHFVGFVDSLVPYYEHADVVIAPLTDGGGMKIKTAEAFSFGKVFLGTTESLHGYYDVLPDNIKEITVFRCDTKEEYIQALLRICTESINKKDESLIRLYEDKFSEEAAVKIVEYIIKDTLSK